MTKDELLNKINETQRKYDFSLVPEHFTYHDKLQIICHDKDSLGREHGIFEITCGHLIHGESCPKCCGRHMDKDLFIHESHLIHGSDHYDYEKFVFQNKNSKSIIHCNIHNIDFIQSPSKHLIGHGCPKCRYESSSGKKRKSQEKFISESKKIWGEDTFDYSEVNYKSSNEKITLICHEKDEFGNEHGKFDVLPTNHLKKNKPQGCPKCGVIKNALHRRKSYQLFEAQASKLHHDKYEYLHDYTIGKNKIGIVCPTHGIFYMTPSNHLIGQGCPKCSLIWTTPEKEILEVIKENVGDIEIITHEKNIISPFEIDIYIPKLHLGIEYNGLVWHSEKFKENAKTCHLNKLELCNNKDIRLIQIFEDEWLNKKNVVISRLKSILGCYDKKIYARKCEVVKLNYNEVMNFLNENHLQGSCHSKYQYALKYENEIVSVMTFGTTRQQKKYNEHYYETWELLRFANKLGYLVIGGASKLLNTFIKELDPYEIISYADKRWSDGNLYFKLNFIRKHDSKPNYFYIFGKERKNRFLFRKSELVKQGYDKNKSEYEIMLERKIYRIYDCGTMVFSLKLK